MFEHIFQFFKNPNKEEETICGIPRSHYDKLLYTATRDESYYYSKFPRGHESIPGFDKIIQSMAERAKATTFSQEIDKCQSISSNCPAKTQNAE